MTKKVLIHVTREAFFDHVAVTKYDAEDIHQAAAAVEAHRLVAAKVPTWERNELFLAEEVVL